MIEIRENMRQEAVQAGWAAYRERLPELKSAYLHACEGWDVHAVCSGVDVIGALFAKDGVIHLGIRPEWRGRWASRRVIRSMLSYGRSTTMLVGEDEAFIHRIGFKKEGARYVVRR